MKSRLWILSSIRKQNSYSTAMARKYLRSIGDDYDLLNLNNDSDWTKHTTLQESLESRYYLQFVDTVKKYDHYIISLGMYNWNLPSRLKCFMDKIIVPSQTFRYLKNGKIEGLLKNKQITFIVSRGGQYKKNREMCFELNYLKQTFKMLGVVEQKEFVFEGSNLTKNGKLIYSVEDALAIIPNNIKTE